MHGDQRQLTGGIANLRLLKTAGSEFHGFVTDRYRTLPDAIDRIFATSVEAVWEYESASADFNATFTAARSALIETLANHHSLAAQHTLLAVGEAVLKDCPSLRRFASRCRTYIELPSISTPFGLKNDNEIFIATDVPYGLISGLIERGES